MGQLTSVLSTLGGVNGVVGAINRTAGNINALGANAAQLKELRQQQEQAGAQLASRQQLEEELAQKKRDQDVAMLRVESDQAERRRVAALKAVTAKQRAAMGGAGVAADDGSGEAVLLGLFQQSDAERADRAAVDDLRQKIIDANYDSLRSRNLLEAAQLSERQSLQRRLI